MMAIATLTLEDAQILQFSRYFEQRKAAVLHFVNVKAKHFVRVLLGSVDEYPHQTIEIYLYHLVTLFDQVFLAEFVAKLDNA